MTEFYRDRPTTTTAPRAYGSILAPIRPDVSLIEKPGKGAGKGRFAGRLGANLTPGGGNKIITLDGQRID